MAIGQFKKGASGPSKGAPPPKRSRWAGVKAAQPRDPMPHAGLYEFRFLGAEEGYNPGKARSSFKVHLEIVDQGEGQTIHRNGDEVQAIFMLSTAAGQGRAKAFVMALAGFEDETEYDRHDPDGELIDAILGQANSRSEEAASLVGRVGKCQVTRGADTGDGDYYREYEWGLFEEQG